MNRIFETIVTVRAADRTQVTPLGVRQQGDLIVLAPFKPSLTLELLLQSRVAVVNYTDDVRVFAGCIVGRRDWPLAPATTVDGVRLASSLAHEEIELVELIDDVQRPQMRCRLVHRETHAPFRGYNRAQAAVIEAAILVSRLSILPAGKLEAELEYLKIAIDKTAGEAELEAWSWLMEAIAVHRETHGSAHGSAR
ncbi:MAG TPA: DUF447 domain-containing protein [Burkholderiaceae bacterium]|jgi:hypothetical protein|nr:DUF447 domain-containing protein [Burkholderiaceae bacterium]